jgi:UDP-N-acetylglucosamine 2-epimerase (non-hydrolysing)
VKIMTVLGTRPEIIRLSRVIPILDETADHTLVHTEQNFARGLSEVFFSELGVREPDYRLGVRADGFGEQIGQILTRIEPLFHEVKPERLLILGDTNSGLVSLVAKRLGIGVYHMEAGNRCHDDRVPEEVNRRVIDHTSSVLLPYTHRSKENLIAEGIERERVFVTGNPIKQVLDHYSAQIDGSTVLADLDVEPGKFFAVTMHRAENVDVEPRLRDLVEALERLHKEYGFPVVCSLHPRTRSKIESFGVDIDRSGLQFVEPLGFFDFVHLEKAAFCLLSDSGTVQEEACIFGRPNVTIRDVTERPETIESGSNILSGTEPETILRHVEFVTGKAADWQPPAEYLAEGVAETVGRIVLGHRSVNAAEAEWSGGQVEPS